MTHILYIGNNLKQKNSNSSYIAILGSLLEKEGYLVTYASSKPKKIARMCDMATSVIRHRKKTDLVLIDTYSTQNFYYALMVSQLCRLLKIPYIPILHGGNLASRLQNNPTLSAMLFKNARYNVAPSQFLMQAFIEDGYLNLKYIPNTIELNNYDFKTHRDCSAPKLLWVRSFSKIYNPTMAVKVLEQLKALGFEASLCMVGPDSKDGSLDETKALAESLGLKVMFPGKLSKQEWIERSQNYNIFINTTNVDNTPLSVIEAMALGLPVVSTNVGGMPFLIEHGVQGLLVEKNNVDEMVQAITTIIQSQQRREQIIHNARQLAETFDWEKVKAQWNQILNQEDAQD